jgi:peptide/nickel transport system permease protein
MAVFREWPVIPIVILTVLVITAVAAPLLAPYDPIRPEIGDRNAKPFWYPDSDGTHLLGADYVGRDVLSRLIYGSRVSLVVLGISLTSGMLVGTAFGLVAGYFGGHVDEIITRIVDMWLAIPFILVALVVVIVFGQSFIVLMALLALLAWIPFVRNVRAEVFVLKTRDFVSIARISGASATRIMVRHLLPNVFNTVVVLATLRVGQLILTESILSFLGAGIPPPTPAWGVMVSDGRNYLASAWWISFFPGLAILLTVLSVNLFGDWLRDRVDPKLREM